MTPEIIDAAQEYIERNTAAGIDALRIDHSAVSATECRDCGYPIPEARRKFVPGVQTCIECQELAEEKDRIRGGI
ncbi:hypothetical protein ABW06_22740 [Pluralibacter gergoviae]|uniref:Zinc finger DksA/TraR C4-type domain-containing protein n=1 Tax=Pluralibacter gergoviae TaxID=61647 RepID=A0A0J5KYG1_PLUGE|nr:TraR/DksA family transcriptional regulator [Pluralibacter gergoviae]KMK11134.1 hypothetical protein ABW06_22740 [Pluralibacter gergoviae]